MFGWQTRCIIADVQIANTAGVFRDVMSAILVCSKPFQTHPVGVEPFSYVKTFFCCNKFA